MRMPLRHTSRVGIALGVSGCLLAAGAAAMSSGTDDGPDRSSQRLRTARAAAAVGYVTERFGVDREEAARRLELQRDLPALDRTLRHRLPGEYAGLWLDQKHGDVVVSTTRPERLQQAVRGLAGRTNFRPRQARWSLHDLEAAQRRLSRHLPTGPADPLSLTVDEQANKVVLYRDGTSAATAALARPAARRALAAEGARARVERLPRPGVPLAGGRPAAARPGPCYVLMCSPPMRAGLRLEVPRHKQDGSFQSYGVCTAGFNIRGIKNRRPYVLTAGHCLGKPETHTGLDHTFHMGMAVSVEDPDLLHYDLEQFYDWAIMPYENANAQKYWIDDYDAKDQALFTAWCRSDSPQPCRSGSAPHTVSGIQSDIRNGMVVCATSAATEFAVKDNKDWFPGTRCGTVRGNNPWSVNTDICNVPGDSGAPLYDPAGDKAVGILQSGVAHAGKCTAGKQGLFTRMDWLLVKASVLVGGPDSPIGGFEAMCWRPEGAPKCGPSNPSK
ncbi:hypothetical protein [Streptomyces sp. NPDC059063]|uniref:hypothetical protein n=1 Tax=unclassified Streptomyces TaxID=2593676 RepID=UPI0036B3279F